MGDNNNCEDDDRWSYFKEPVELTKMGMKPKKSKHQEPEFNECLTKILLQKAQRQRQEYLCKTAANLVKIVTDISYTLSTEWREYINANEKSGVVTTPLRTLAEDQYECMVPLKRPMRLDAFKVYQRGIYEMPQHRCLIQVNPALCNEEGHLVKREWEPFVDNDGFLRPKGILSWFNKGLNRACPEVLSENHNVDKLGCSVGEDGTAVLNVTMSDFNNDELVINVFSVNIYPVYILDTLPSSLKLNAPLPCFGNYIQGQKEFRRLVLNDMENGKHIAFLDPKSEITRSPVKKCLPKDCVSWRLNLSFTEHHVYSLIDKYCRGLNFRHVLVLLNILRDELPDELGVLNNDIFVNTLFNVSQKHIDAIRDKKEWVYKVVDYLIKGLRQHFLPCFYLPRLNLLHVYNISQEAQTNARDTLSIVLSSIKQRPRFLYKFTGYVEPVRTSRGPSIQSHEQEQALDIPDCTNIRVISALSRKTGLSINPNDNRADSGMDNSGDCSLSKNESLQDEDNVEHDENESETAMPTRLLSPPRFVIEEESAITRLTKKEERSDFY